ncbi:MAG: hypothetical protein ACPIOQ_16415 [Promethearchaeia archaeon]
MQAGAGEEPAAAGLSSTDGQDGSLALDCGKAPKEEAPATEVPSGKGAEGGACQAGATVRKPAGEAARGGHLRGRSISADKRGAITSRDAVAIYLAKVDKSPRTSFRCFFCTTPCHTCSLARKHGVSLQ